MMSSADRPGSDSGDLEASLPDSGVTQVDPKPGDSLVPELGASGSTLHSIQPERAASSLDEPATLEELPISFESPRPALERLSHGDEIARGGMASVRVAFDPLLLRRVAVKRLRLEGDPRYKWRFLEEAQVTAQLDHPNVVPVHDVGLDPLTEQPFFTMKLVEGHTLAAVIDELHKLDLTPERLEPVLQMIVKVCDAVAFAHSRRVVHRDLKPDNVMVGTHGQVYVMDWGVARVLNAGALPSGVAIAPIRDEPNSAAAFEKPAFIGTPDYMAPEQAAGLESEIDERTDVFGIGGILYYLLTGLGPYSRPKSGFSLSHRGSVDAAEEHGVWPRLPPGLCQITKKALALDKHARYQSVEELRLSLQEFLRGGGWFATQRFRAGEIIVHEGEVGESAYILVEGQCEVYRSDENGKQTLRELGPGEVFGETAVLTRKPRTATVAALSDVAVKVVTRASLENELSRNPWLDAFVRSLAERFREVDAEVASHRRGRPSSLK